MSSYIDTVKQLDREIAAKRGGTYRLLNTYELTLQPPQLWLLADLIPTEGTGVIYGEPGCGKSFLAWDLFAAVARGLRWANRRTRRARVVYIVLEGSARNRSAAYHKAHGVDRIENMHVMVNQSFSLLAPEYRPAASNLAVVAQQTIHTPPPDAASIHASPQRFCIHCGTRVLADAKFCLSCGASIDRAAVAGDRDL